MIIKIYEAKHISRDCKCKFDSTICNSNQKWKNDICQCKSKNYSKCKKYYIWNPSTCISENSKYLEIILDDSKTVCDEIINVTDNVQQMWQILYPQMSQALCQQTVIIKKEKYFKKNFD